jgi:hypothetical protein
MRPRAASSAGHSDASPLTEVTYKKPTSLQVYAVTLSQLHIAHQWNIRSTGQGFQILEKSLQFREGQEEKLRYMSVQQQRMARSAKAVSLTTYSRNARPFSRTRRVVEFDVSKHPIQVLTSQR